MTKYGRVTPSMKPTVLRKFYKDLTGDSTAASNEHEAEIDERVRLLLEMEDPDILLDMRALNTNNRSQYDVFWYECQKYLEGIVGTPVDGWCHGHVTHLANAISARDLIKQVKARCPEGTEIPSVSWLRFQFWPKSHHAHSKNIILDD